MQTTEKDPRHMTPAELAAEIDRLEKRLRVAKQLAKYLARLDEDEAGDEAK